MSKMLMGIFVAYLTSSITSDKKNRRYLKMAAILKMSKYWTLLQFDIRNEKIIPNYERKNIFMVMTSSMTSQSDLKAVSLYSFLNEKNSIFHDNWRTNKDIIFKLSVHMYHWIVNMRWQTILDCYVDDVIGSENNSKLWTAIALSIFELEHRSKAQNVTYAMAIFVAYSNSSFTSGKNIRRDLKRRPFWKCQN